MCLGIRSESCLDPRDIIFVTPDYMDFGFKDVYSGISIERIMYA
jgi:hypothetical protein